LLFGFDDAKPDDAKDSSNAAGAGGVLDLDMMLGDGGAGGDSTKPAGQGTDMLGDMMDLFGGGGDAQPPQNQDPNMADLFGGAPQQPA
jgi:hypothetical protein